MRLLKLRILKINTSKTLYRCQQFEIGIRKQLQKDLSIICSFNFKSISSY